MTAYALCADDTGLACLGVEGDGLMTAILTGDITASAADAALAVDLRIDDGIPVEVMRHHDMWQLFSHDILEVCDVTRCQVCLQSRHEIVDDAIAVLFADKLVS